MLIKCINGNVDEELKEGEFYDVIEIEYDEPSEEYLCTIEIDGLKGFYSIEAFVQVK